MVDIPLTSSNDFSETPWRPAIPLNVSPARTTYVAPDALDAMDAYPWPGNVDELARVVADAHGRAEGTEIVVVDLPECIHLAADAVSRPPRPDETIELDAFLARITFPKPM